MAKKSAAKSDDLRRVSFDVDRALCEQIEKRSLRSVDDLAKDFIETWIRDGRHRMHDAKQIGVAWPVDWYQQMLRIWGERAISPVVRELIHKELSTPRNPLPEPPVEKTFSAIHKDRVVEPSSSDRLTIISHLLLPMSYHDRLIEVYGRRKVSTGVKAIMYRELIRRKCKVEVPKGLARFI